jgi:predicted transcriptional regulator of viral defense system
MKLSQYINQLQQTGRKSFSKDEAVKALHLPSKAFDMALLRLRKKGTVVTPYKNFHIIVPPEYQVLGCLPANQLIPLLMEHLKISYYVCLLSAAELHGAAHQRPQIFHVMTNKRMRPIHCGKITVNFIFKKDLSYIPTQPFNVPTGYLITSTPEATAMDLFLYPYQAGGINHIATVLSELVEAIEPQKLLVLARSSAQNAWVQRLGYILEKIDPYETTRKVECIKFLREHVQGIHPSYVSLIARGIRSLSRDKTWRIIVNTDIDSDI